MAVLAQSRRVLLQLGLIISLAAPPAPALAGEQSLGLDGPVQIVGGPGNTAHWTIVPDGGTSTGRPDSNADCLSAVDTGLLVDDADLGAQGDAYDQAGVWINGRVFTSTVTSVNAQTLTAGPMPAGGLNATLEYYAVGSSPTLRTLVSFANPTSQTLPVTATLAINFGSDIHTAVLASSTGDQLLGGADRWLVTGDGPSVVTDVVNTTIWLGPGFGTTPPTLVTDQVFACPGTGDTAGVLAEFKFTVPAGATRRLMFFHQINASPAAALAGAPQFDTTPSAGDGRVAGLTPTQLREIINWGYQPLVFLPQLYR